MQEGVAGLLRDKTRPPGRAPLDAEIIERVVALTAQDPPGEVTHWTAGMMAKAVGISVSSVLRIGNCPTTRRGLRVSRFAEREATNWAGLGGRHRPRQRSTAA